MGADAQELDADGIVAVLSAEIGRMVWLRIGHADDTAAVFNAIGYLVERPELAVERVPDFGLSPSPGAVCSVVFRVPADATGRKLLYPNCLSVRFEAGKLCVQCSYAMQHELAAALVGGAAA